MLISDHTASSSLRNAQEKIILNTRQAFEQRLKLDASGALIAELNGHILSSRFQPIWGRKGELFAYEALMRVQDAQGQFIAPDLYLDSLTPDQRVDTDRLARVIHLRNFVLSGATCRLSMNMIPLTLIHDNETSGAFSLLLNRLLEMHIAPSRIILEVVEHSAQQGNQALAAALQQAAKAGVHIAVDDYGEQASDLQRINTLQPNVIKVDRCVLLQYMAGAQHVLHEVLRQAHERGSRVIVEGIETQDQYQAMHDVGVEGFQGFFLGKPAPLPIVPSLYPLIRREVLGQFDVPGAEHRPDTPAAPHTG